MQRASSLRKRGHSNLGLGYLLGTHYGSKEYHNPCSASSDFLFEAQGAVSQIHYNALFAHLPVRRNDPAAPAL
jgi:hypothetical protein